MDANKNYLEKLDKVKPNAAKVILSPQRATGATAHRAKYASIKKYCFHEVSKIGF
jgi:uracil phosphoribosyltransferase